jgi:hypothetical protein
MGPATTPSSTAPDVLPDGPGTPEQPTTWAGDLLGGGANWGVVKKAFTGFALAGLAALGVVVMRPRRE